MDVNVPYYNFIITNMQLQMFEYITYKFKLTLKYI